MLGGLSLTIRQVLAMEERETILASMSSPNSKRGNKFQATLTLTGVQNLEDADPIPKKTMEVIRNFLQRTVLSLVVLTVESADRALMPAAIVVRAGTWLRTSHGIGVRLEIMLSLGLIHRVLQQPSLLRGTGSMP